MSSAHSRGQSVWRLLLSITASQFITRLGVRGRERYLVSASLNTNDPTLLELRKGSVTNAALKRDAGSHHVMLYCG